jgi:hypothetical protein
MQFPFFNFSQFCFIGENVSFILQIQQRYTVFSSYLGISTLKKILILCTCTQILHRCTVSFHILEQGAQLHSTYWSKEHSFIPHIRARSTASFHILEQGAQLHSTYWSKEHSCIPHIRAGAQLHSTYWSKEHSCIPHIGTRSTASFHILEQGAQLHSTYWSISAFLVDIQQSRTVSFHILGEGAFFSLRPFFLQQHVVHFKETLL